MIKNKQQAQQYINLFIILVKGNIKFLKHIMQNIFNDSVQSHHVATENSTRSFANQRN